MKYLVELFDFHYIVQILTPDQTHVKTHIDPRELMNDAIPTKMSLKVTIHSAGCQSIGRWTAQGQVTQGARFEPTNSTRPTRTRRTDERAPHQ